MFAETGNIWPQRRCKAWASAAREWESEASVLLRATARRNVWVAVLQRPPTSSARTTSLQRPCCPNSGQVFQFGRPIHCWTSQNPLPKGHQTLFQRSRSRSAGTNVRINCYLPRANCTNSSIDCSHNAGLPTATFCQLSHRFHLVNSSIFVTHVFGLLPTLFTRGCHSNARSFCPM